MPGDDLKPHHLPPPQGGKLEMVRLSSAPVFAPSLPLDYCLRLLGQGEETAYAALYRQVFDDMSRLGEMPGKTLPGGCFVVEHMPTRRLVASCRAYLGTGHARHPAGGQLAWLVTDPAYGRKGLGTIVAAAVTNRLAEAGYRQPFLRTDDGRLPAISIYLRLGWQASLYSADMHRRWRRVFAALGLAEHAPPAERTPDV